MLFSSSTLMITSPGRLVEKVLFLRTSWNLKMLASRVRVTCCSTCSEVAPGKAAATIPVRMVTVGSSVRGM